MNIRIVLAIGLVGMSMSAFAAENKAKMGTWTLDLARSSPEFAAARKSEVRVYERMPDGAVRSTRHTVFADGHEEVAVYTAKDDGKEYKIVDAKGHESGTFSFTSDGKTDTFITRRGGVQAVEGTTTTSADGQTLIMTLRTGADPAARKENKAIYAKTAAKP